MSPRLNIECRIHSAWLKCRFYQITEGLSIDDAYNSCKGNNVIKTRPTIPQHYWGHLLHYPLVRLTPQLVTSSRTITMITVIPTDLAFSLTLMALSRTIISSHTSSHSLSYLYPTSRFSVEDLGSSKRTCLIGKLSEQKLSIRRTMGSSTTSFLTPLKPHQAPTMATQ